jgi:hopene-associated glycosyltransferase HpnB
VSILISFISLAAWLYLTGFRGKFWSSSPTLDTKTPSGKATVAVIVPARNEVENIGQSLRSLLAQDYAGEIALIMVDDNSADGTTKIAASLGAADRMAIIPGCPLPPGWSGKMWAVHQGLEHEKAQTADYVLLTDADIEHDQKHVSTLVAEAETSHLDLVSEMVHLHCVTAAERALIPAFVFFFQMLYPFAWVADPAKRTAGAAGGTMLVSRAALNRVEGVYRIRNELIDDCALAKLIKSTGGEIWLGHAGHTISTRIYSTWRDVWDMIARTAYVQLRRSPLMLLGCIIGMGVLYCAPPILTLFAHGVPCILGFFSWAIMAAVFQPTLRRYHLSPVWGITLPFISAFYLCATVTSAVRHYAGHGGGWKDRVYTSQ